MTLSPQRFPAEHVESCARDAELQELHAAELANVLKTDWARDLGCPLCGGGDLEWIYFRSPEWTWKNLCGRAGWVARCRADQTQAAFRLAVMN